MKNLLFYSVLATLLFSCNNLTDKSKSSNKTTQSLKVDHKQFFDYDEIDYYFTNYDDSKIAELAENRSKAKLDSIKYGVLLGDIPNEISDLSFLPYLEKLGYTKSSIDKSKFTDINSIFIEKSTAENVYTACIFVYRDILIFKKQSKIIGTAKICFGCMDNQIRGTKGNTKNFGQDGDYSRLRKILRN